MHSSSTTHLHMGICAMLGGSLLSGCAAPGSDVQLLLRGPQQTFDQSGANLFATNRVNVLSEINRAAGFDAAGPTNGVEWKAFVITAFDYADSQCEEYITAIRRLNIVRRQTTQQMNLTGAATAGILGITGAAGSAIAATAVAFGFAQATVDNIAGGFLYELPPYTVRELVTRLRVEYSNGLNNSNWSDRATSFRTIRGYVQLCLPAVIEAHAAAAIASASIGTIKQSTSSTAVGAPPSVVINPIAISSSQPTQTPPVNNPTVFPSGIPASVVARRNRLLQFVRTTAAQALAGDDSQRDLLSKIAIALGVPPAVTNVNEQRTLIAGAIDRAITSTDQNKATEQMNELAEKLKPFGAF